jgi:hypothetical protein
MRDRLRRQRQMNTEYAAAWLSWLRRLRAAEGRSPSYAKSIDVLLDEIGALIRLENDCLGDIRQIKHFQSGTRDQERRSQY